jgi:putative GTP pyrophosphokinase
MIDGNAIEDFRAAYADHVRGVLLPTRQALKRVLKRWTSRDYWEKYRDASSRAPAPAPIQRAFPRIKRPESVIDKIRRKPESFPDGFSIASVERMTDAIAGRIVIYFLAGFPLVDRELRGTDEIEISTHLPPMAYLGSEMADRLGLGGLRRADKSSGYASVHYIVRLRDVPGLGRPSPWLELQVRTLAEDAWGEIEHILGYKPDKRTSFAVKQQFRIISAILSAIDQHFNFLYDELRRFQHDVEFEQHDTLNAENISAALADCGVGCTQRDIDGALKALASAGVTSIGKLQSIATARRCDVIHHTYMSEEGRVPTNFEMIAALASIGATPDPHDAELVRANIKMLRTWNQLQQDMATSVRLNPRL